LHKTRKEKDIGGFVVQCITSNRDQPRCT